jgi:hypothetical protein
MTNPYDDLHIYYGDLHSHCNVGYGHGSIEDAFQNAGLQLDFVCVTPHAYWHDMPEDPRLAAVVDYHRRGFERATAQWDHVQNLVRERHHTGKFVTFLGFEWHSRRYGDHNIYFKGNTGSLIRADDMPDLRSALRQLRAAGTETMLIPHHIGYKAGYRGINWEEVDPEFIHLVEIMSMHGAAESPTMPNRYLHTMGPLDWRSSLQYGLAQGHVVGVIGSTDHHSAHPGSYGHGRAGVWADGLTRDGIWSALTARRTYALTGDRIVLQFALNNQPMGAVVPPSDRREIEIHVVGGDAFDYIELLHDNRRVRRWSPDRVSDTRWPNTVKVYLELGWGERAVDVDWHVELNIVDGDLIALEPRFRGHEIVEPQANEQTSYAFSTWQHQSDHGVTFTTRTWGNPTTTTANTQGMCFEIRADSHTRLVGTINGQPVDVPVSDLLYGPRAEYVGGFLTPAYCFHRAVPLAEYTAHVRFTHETPGDQRDWYHVRVRQQNGHWAWSSPIWVEPSRA